ncbi:MAG: NAD-dependent epimerase/dehydratase family protein [Burkholderiaceae bacterium]
MTRTRCLVIGGAGFIGSHIVDALLLRGHRVRVFDRIDPRLYRADRAHAELEYVQGDFCSVTDLQGALADCNTCFHLASTTLPKTSNDNPVFDVETNLLATLKLLQQASRSGMKRMIFLSSGGTVYGVPRYVPIDEGHPTDPTNSYGIVKLAIEKYLALFKAAGGLDYVVLRISNPFGEGQRITGAQGVIAVFMGKVLKGEPLEVWGDGSVVRDYVYIRDVVEAMLASMDYEGEHRIFNIGSGRPLSLIEVIDAIEKVTNRRVERRFHEARSFDVPVSVLSIERARQYLGWSPKTEFFEGLSRTRDWIETELRDGATRA